MKKRWMRIISMVLTVTMVFGSIVSVSAAEPIDAVTTQNAATTQDAATTPGDDEVQTSADAQGTNAAADSTTTDASKSEASDSSTATDAAAGAASGTTAADNAATGTAAVSYTHLDVYKRQTISRARILPTKASSVE